MSGKNRNRWINLADAEAAALLEALPVSLRDRLSTVSITFSGRPSGSEIIEEGDEEELLGLFIGSPIGEADADSELSPEIRLYVENIRDEVDGDEIAFRQEVRTTLLHEIGHYLGLDEDGLDLRGLS